MNKHIKKIQDFLFDFVNKNGAIITKASAIIGCFIFIYFAAREFGLIEADRVVRYHFGKTSRLGDKTPLRAKKAETGKSSEEP